MFNWEKMKEMCRSPQTPTHCSSPSSSRYAVEELISAVSFVSVFSLLQLPFEKIDGNPVPTIIFKDRPSLFQAFVLGLNFAFCGGIMTISLRQIYPRIADICRYISMLSMFMASSIFSGLAIPWAVVALFHESSLSVAAA